MTVSLRKTTELYEHFAGKDRSSGAGRYAAVNKFRHMLGLSDEHGNDYKDRAGNRILKEQVVRPEEFATDELAIAIMGPETRAHFQNGSTFARAVQHRQMVESVYPEDRQALLEAVGVGIDVSSFANINAWTSVVGGLIEVKILEAFKNPVFIGDMLCPPEPTRLNGQKIIGAARIGAKGEQRQPGETHKRAGFGERYVTTPQTRENGLAVDVFKEAAFFDLTGQVLEHAAGVGEWLGYAKELDQIDCFLGVTSGISGVSTGVSAFNYKGTAYGTYQTTITNGYLNQSSNELLDWTNLEAAWLLFQRMQDPETSTRVLTNPNMMLVNPKKVATAKLILGAIETERRSAGSSTQSGVAVLQVQRTPGAPFAGDFQLLWSPLAEQRCTDATGLNLSQANADKYWYMWERGRPFKYMQNWPLSTAQAPPNNYEMLDRGIVATTFANERGIPATWSPWHTVVSTN